MNLQHINVKLFVDGQLEVELERFVEVFHGWVAAQSMGELLIDVADYRHVPAGPAVALIGHEADYVLDNAGNRMGLLYNRKAVCEGSNADKLSLSLTAAVSACERLEKELPGLKFDHNQFELTIADRALAPNSPETLQAFEPILADFVRETLGQPDYSIEHDADSRRLFAVTVTLGKR